MNKTCSRCKIAKPLDNFSKDKNRVDGKTVHCRVCAKAYRTKNRTAINLNKKRYRAENLARVTAYQRQHYKENSKRIMEDNRKFYENNRDVYLLKKSRERAKKSGLEHSLTLEDLKIPTHCPYLGIELTCKLGSGQLKTNASVDRIDSSKGYVKDNVQIVSRQANTMKNDATLEELITSSKNVLRLAGVYPFANGIAVHPDS